MILSKQIPVTRIADNFSYEQCQSDIETAFDLINTTIYTCADTKSIRLALAWLYGGLSAVFIWENMRITGVDYDEWQYYFCRLQSAIKKSNQLGHCGTKEYRSIYLHCADLLQKLQAQLMVIKATKIYDKIYTG